MSVGTVNYVPCVHCGYDLIGRTETTLFLRDIGNWAVFEVCITWICLRCGKIQREEFHIRENRF